MNCSSFNFKILDKKNKNIKDHSSLSPSVACQNQSVMNDLNFSTMHQLCPNPVPIPSQSCLNPVPILSQSCPNPVPILSQSCSNPVPILSQSCSNPVPII